MLIYVGVHNQLNCRMACPRCILVYYQEDAPYVSPTTGYIIAGRGFTELESDRCRPRRHRWYEKSRDLSGGSCAVEERGGLWRRC